MGLIYLQWTISPIYFPLCLGLTQNTICDVFISGALQENSRDMYAWQLFCSHYYVVAAHSSLEWFMSVTLILELNWVSDFKEGRDLVGT